MRALMAVLGEPQRVVPAVHVAGTNGKGSVVALVSEALRAGGRRVARFTSPHLVDPCERFWLDGGAIPAAQLEALVLDEVAAAAHRVQAEAPELGAFTPFELLTAAFFAWTARAEAEVQVVEVGLGGRLDATNVLDSPAVTAVTSVGLDHRAILGHDVATIAAEKGGIAKAGAPLVTGATGEVLEVLRRCAARAGAPLVTLPAPELLAGGAEGQRVRLSGRPFNLALLGAHQAANAAVALGVLDALRARPESAALAVDEEAIAFAFASTRWPGRLEPLEAQGGPWLLDGAHNPDGVDALRAALHRHFPGRRWVAVFGALADKGPSELLAAFAAHGTAGAPAPAIDAWVLTTPGGARAADPEALRAAVPGAAEVVTPVPVALARARELAGDGPVLVFGSLHLVGAARAWLLG